MIFDVIVGLHLDGFHSKTPQLHKHIRISDYIRGLAELFILLQHLHNSTWCLRGCVLISQGSGSLSCTVSVLFAISSSFSSQWRMQ